MTIALYRLQIRDADRLLIEDSFFNSTSRRDAIEIFNVASVSVAHTEFLNGSTLLLNRVGEFNISDSLLDREALEVLTENVTKIHWKCTVSPLVSPSDVLKPAELEMCSNVGRISKSGNDEVYSSAGSGGAIVLAVVSAVLLIVAVTVLVVLHRSGKLDQYL